VAVIHRTTITPGKLELVARWLPRRPWYRGNGRPHLRKAGGFRLDDPVGEVGLEFMVVTDQSGEVVVAYDVPVTYRGAPLPGAEGALIGTSEHGMLGRRWVYDGAHDPVLINQLFDLLRGRTQPQAQSASNTPDESVVVDPVGANTFSIARFTVDDGADSSDIVLEGTDGAGSAQQAVVRLIRILQSTDDRPRPDTTAPTASVNAGWTLPDGSVGRGQFVRLMQPTRSSGYVATATVPD